MRNTERSLLALLLGVFLVISGCGSSSTDSDAETADSGDETTVKSSKVTCSQTNLCVGSYSTNVVAGEGSVNGPCQVLYVDASDEVTIVFEKEDSCNFKRVIATGDTGSNWAAVASLNKRLLVHHKGVDVYLLRVFAE